MDVCKIDKAIRWRCDRDTTDLEMKIFRIMPEIKQLIDIDYIYVVKEHRNKFIGTKALKEYCESQPNELLLFISGALIDEYKIEPFDFQYKEILDKLDNFLVNVGFLKISGIKELLESGISDYKYNEIYVYENKLGLDLSNRLTKELNKKRT